MTERQNVYMSLFGAAGLIIAAALAVNWLVDFTKPRLTSFLARNSDKVEPNKVFRYRRWETFVGIYAAVTKLITLFLTLYLIWRNFMPSTAPAALVGASAFFAIVIGSTLGPLLRDLTAGTLMIAERWYNVGDHISVEPFGNVKGVVEQLTPRSTKIRSLSGESIWMHNQYIQAVRVTRGGVRTISLDVFVSSLAGGKRVIEEAIKTLPTGPLMVSKQLAITDTEKLSDGLWRITAVAQTTHGREWLIEDFAVKAIIKCDKITPGKEVIVHGPIASYTDPTAEKRFARMVRSKS